MPFVKPVQRDACFAIRKNNAVRNYLLGSIVIAAFCNAVYEYADLLKSSWGVTGKPEKEAMRLLLADERNFVTSPTSIGAYIDSILGVNRDIDLCKTAFPDSKLFDEYPLITHDGAGVIPNRPEGTIAYAFTITSCPEFSTSGVGGTSDPIKRKVEATTIIKDEICDATDALEIMRKENGSLVGQTL